MERNARIEIASILGIWHALTKSSIEVCFFLVSLHQRDDYVSSGDLILLKQKKKKEKKEKRNKKKKIENTFLYVVNRAFGQKIASFTSVSGQITETAFPMSNF